VTGVDENQLLTASDVAARWQVSKEHVYHLTREGWLPCVELGRCRRYRLVAVEAFEIGGGTSDRGEVQSPLAKGHQTGVQASRSAECEGAQPSEGENSTGRVWLLKPLPDAVRDWIAVFFGVAQIALVLLVASGETTQIQNITIHPARQRPGNSRASERSGAEGAASRGQCLGLSEAAGPVGVDIPCLSQSGLVVQPTTEEQYSAPRETTE